MFQKITQTERNKSKSSFNDFKWRKWHYVAVKNYQHY